MRFYRTLPGGSTLDVTSFFMNRSLVSRMLMLGLPLLTLVLLLIFLTTSSSIEHIINRAIARNAQLQAQAMSLALEHALAETRNQLLILAAGSMEPQDMARRMEFRAKTDGLLGVNIMVALSNFSQLGQTALEEKIDFIFSGAGLPSAALALSYRMLLFHIVCRMLSRFRGKFLSCCRFRLLPRQP